MKISQVIQELNHITQFDLGFDWFSHMLGIPNEYLFEKNGSIEIVLSNKKLYKNPK